MLVEPDSTYSLGSTWYLLFLLPGVFAISNSISCLSLPLLKLEGDGSAYPKRPSDFAGEAF